MILASPGQGGEWFDPDARPATWSTAWPRGTKSASRSVLRRRPVVPEPDHDFADGAGVTP